MTRDKAAIKLRIFSNIQSAVVFGTIWWRLRKIQSSVPSRLGMLQVRMLFLGSLRALLSLPNSEGSFGRLKLSLVAGMHCLFGKYF